MIEVRPIEDGDMDFVRANLCEEVAKVCPDMPTPEHSYTVVFNGEIIAVGGLIIFWPGVGELWMIRTPKSKEAFGYMLANAIRSKVNELIAEHRLWRCEAQARAQLPDAIRLIKALGFTQVCVREMYLSDGTDMILYARINKEYAPVGESP